jgi:sterol desaturase/sphingolipid hydroxylase (fatty acid hydroxylase superfamily)
MSEILWDGKSLNPAALAIPAFFIFVALEFLAARKLKRPETFSFDSSVVNISVGIAERLLSLFLTASFYNIFQYIHQHFALWDIPNHWLVWLLLILSTDLVWYWYHRLGHEINLFWAAHIVHHQSEEFNYTVSARITIFQAIIRNVFWSTLPFIGFHPDMVMVTLLIHGTYSFFTHTQLINKLGWFEYIFITPSHHRVHHASNEKYLNKNYGDLFIFWDKIFGTFQKEEETPVYGLTHPLKSYSFIWQHFHYFMEIIHAASGTPGFLNKLRVIFGSPEQLDQNIRAQLEKKFLPLKQRPKQILKRHKVYLIIQLTAAVLTVFFVTLFYNDLPGVGMFAGSALVLLTLINCGALLEQRRWIYYLEYIRLLVVSAALSYYFRSPEILTGSAFLIAIAVWPLQKWYLKTVYDIS